MQENNLTKFNTLIYKFSEHCEIKPFQLEKGCLQKESKRKNSITAIILIYGILNTLSLKLKKKKKGKDAHSHYFCSTLFRRSYTW